MVGHRRHQIRRRYAGRTRRPLSADQANVAGSRVSSATESVTSSSVASIEECNCDGRSQYGRNSGALRSCKDLFSSLADEQEALRMNSDSNRCVNSRRRSMVSSERHFEYHPESTYSQLTGYGRRLSATQEVRVLPNEHAVVARGSACILCQLLRASASLPRLTRRRSFAITND